MSHMPTQPDNAVRVYILAPELPDPVEMALCALSAGDTVGGEESPGDERRAMMRV